MPNVLFIASHRMGRSPSQRFRFEQYFSYLEENGFSCHLSYLINAREDKIFYSEGNWLSKACIILKSFLQRKKEIRSLNQFEIVFVQREAFMLGSVFFEKNIQKSRAKFIFDFDDSIWLNDTSEANKKFEWLKNPSKTAKNISFADLVFAGNEYLASYARAINSNVVVMPTTIDTEEYTPNRIEKEGQDKIVIGWIGSITTIKHFEYALGFLKILKEKYGSRIEFKVVGDPTYTNQSLGIQGIEWSKEKEVELLNEFDIGIMPLPNDEWANGKCACKGLQYMALEIPTVMSPVGVNSSIIQQGENGFLASDDSEWVEVISSLIESPQLRKKVGGNARQTVIEKFSVLSQRENYLRYFRQVLSQ